MDNRLLKLKVDIDEKPPIIQLKNDIAAFTGKLELNAAGKNLKNNTNYKAIIKKIMCIIFQMDLKSTLRLYPMIKFVLIG